MKSGSKTCRVGTCEVTHKGKRRGRKKMLTVEEFKRKAEEYFEECRSKEIPVTVSGMAYHMGFSSVQSIHDYMKDPEYKEAVQRAYLGVERYTEEGLIAGEIPPAAGIFTMKARFGLVDKNAVDHTSSDGSLSPKTVDSEMVKSLVDKLTD